LKYVFKTKPYKHQAKALKRIIRQGYLAVFWEPGMGKTKLIVDAACAWFQMGKVQRVLIVCPLSVVGVWEEEFEMHATNPYKIQFLDRKTEKLRRRKNTLEIVVTNYDIVWRRPHLVTAFDPQFVIADESHRIKKASTKRTWFMRSLHYVPHKAILTGTPNPKSFLDLYGQWLFLNQKTFGTRVSDFKERYLIFGGFKNYQIRGYNNVDELKQKVKKDATIRRKDQALDLPERVHQSVPVLLEPEARRQYDVLEEEFFLELSKGEVIDVKNALVKLLRLQQLTGGWINTDQGLRQISTAKLKVCEDLLVDRYEEGLKVVVFARFRPEIADIESAARKAGYKKVYTLTGSTPKADRDTNRRAFQSDDGPGVFIAQIQSGGLGITLHAAHEAIFYSVTYALDEFVQACDRLHRIGQEHKVTYRHLVCVNSIDRDIFKALKDKQEVMAYIMGHPRY